MNAVALATLEGEVIMAHRRAAERYVRGLEIVHQINCAILAMCSPGEIAATTLRYLRSWIGCDLRTNIMSFDWEAGTAQVLAVDVPGEAHWPAGSHVPLDYLGSLDALRRGEPVVADDLAAVPQTTVNTDLIQALEVRGCMLVPMLAEDELVGIINLVASSAHVFDPGDVEIVQQVAGAVAVAIRQAQLAKELDSAYGSVHTLSGRLLQVQEMERQRLARELHDEIGQHLTAVKLNLQALLGAPSADGQSRRLQEGIHLIDSAIARVRELSVDLRPSALDDLGLVAALRWYSDREGQRSGLAVQFSADPPEMALPAEVEIVAFRIAQEAITNVLRHARARNVAVHVVQLSGVLELCIRDDGIGFEPANMANGSLQRGLGLLGMHERAQLAGGKVRIDSAPGRGTAVYASLPVSPPAAFSSGVGGALPPACLCARRRECPLGMGKECAWV